jgi:hypothetical protein
MLARWLVAVVALANLPVVVPAAQVPTGTSASARTLDLTLEPGGLVTLKAQNVTVRDVLAEWARQCRCFIVNAQNLQGGPIAIPMLFERAPQQRVLESLLRQAAGYVLTPQRPGANSLSSFETIYIVAVSNPAPTAYSAPPPAAAMLPPPTPGSPDDEIPPVTPMPAQPRPSNTPAPPAEQPAANQPPPAPRPPGTPGVFVPIVPIGPAQPAPGPTPGSVTPAPQGR